MRQYLITHELRMSCYSADNIQNLSATLAGKIQNLSATLAGNIFELCHALNTRLHSN